MGGGGTGVAIACVDGSVETDVVVTEEETNFRKVPLLLLLLLSPEVDPDPGTAALDATLLML